MFEHFYPNENFNVFKINHLFSEHFLLVERFLAEIEFSNNKLEQRILCLESLLKNGNERIFNKILKKTAKEHAKKIHRFYDRTYYEYRIKEIEYKHIAKAKNRSSAMDKLFQKSNALASFFTGKQLTDSLVYKDSMSSEKANIFNEFDNKASLVFAQKSDNAFMKVLYYLHLLRLDSDKFEYFSKIKKLIESEILHKDDLKLLCGLCINYCAGQVNKGYSDFFNNILYLFKLQIKKDILIENNEITEWTFKNIVLVGLKTNNHEWTKGFIELYRKYLPEDVRENAYAYNLARLFFELKKYEEAQFHALKVRKHRCCILEEYTFTFG